jgi:hypothetical protein
MLVYRVENSEGGGPYTFYSFDKADKAVVAVSNALKEAHNESHHHPPPHSDGISFVRHYERCGFVSIEDLVQWFDGWLQKLHDVGFRMAIYDVPTDRVRAGEKQVVFDPFEGINRLATSATSMPALSLNWRVSTMNS